MGVLASEAVLGPTGEHVPTLPRRAAGGDRRGRETCLGSGIFVGLENWPLLVVLAVAAAGVWFAAKPAAVFVVQVRGGVPQASRGKVTAAFLAAVADVCGEFGISAGEIRGVPRRHRRISLRFSASFPSASQQRLRNWWAQSGWSIRP